MGLLWRLGLIDGDRNSYVRAALIVVALTWAPLALLALLEGVAIGPDPRDSFLLDFAAYSRLLLASPLLLIAGATHASRLDIVARQFMSAGLVPSTERAQYDYALTSSARLLGSLWTEAVIIALAYGLTLGLDSLMPDTRATWRQPGSRDSGGIFLTAWWYTGVSSPLAFAILLGVLWRVAVWARFLLLLSRMKLRLLASHPDLTGGMQFISASLRASAPICFALSAQVTGAVANQVLYENRSPSDYLYAVVALVLLMLLFFVSPMTAFYPMLRRVKSQGLFDYGVLAADMGGALERKWIRQRPADQNPLAVPDFSATTDLNQIVGNVRSMRCTPIELYSLKLLTGSTLAPFIPLMLVTLPVREVLGQLIKFLV
jgi:hypothetical protein